MQRTQIYLQAFVRKAVSPLLSGLDGKWHAIIVSGEKFHHSHHLTLY
jgi:hypothetical protein